MGKKLWAAVLSAVCIISTCIPVFAAESGNKVITFKGEAEKFVVQSSGSTEGFTGMQPGESRDITITLRNDDYNEMKFYMSADILDNIAEKGNQEAVYVMNIAKDGNTFFETIVGNEENAAGKEYLDENNNILLSTLAKGEQTEVTISLTLDGDSAGNDYMNESGNIQLIFSAATPEEPETIIETVKKYVTGSGSSTYKAGKVKTGDESPVFVFGLLAVFSAAVIGIMYFRRKRV